MSGPEQPIAVSCAPMGEGFACRVTVGADAGATTHEVTVSRESARDLHGAASPTALVEESFRFLLEREPRESILRRFEIGQIARYFPEYPAEIMRRNRAR